MYHHIHIIKEYPPSVINSFCVPRFGQRLQLFLNRVANGFDVDVRVAGADDEEIGDGSLFPNV
jgi:hypothetical protein